MSQLENVVSRVAFTGKQLLNHSADLFEWSANKNLEVAGDVAKFAVQQMRLPVQAESLAGLREDVKVSYGKFGGELKSHGTDVVARVRTIPTELREIVLPRQKPVKKTTAKKATKKAASKKATTKKAA